MLRRKASHVASIGALLLTSCSQGAGSGPLGLGAVFGERTLATAEPLFSREEERCLDSPTFLLAMFNPHPDFVEQFGGKAGDQLAPSWQSEDCRALLAQLRLAIRRDENLSALMGKPKPPSAEAQAATASMAGLQDRMNEGWPDAEPAPPRAAQLEYTEAERNEIIDALIAASNRKCGRYAALLKSYDSGANSALSVASIVTGGFGAITQVEKTARLLAGASSMFSGARSALNEVYFTNQTIHVLTEAFEKVRRDARRDISHREDCPIEHYSVMRGFEDALAYHNNCSIVVGLAETARAVQRAEQPGLDTMKRSLTELAALRLQAEQFAARGSRLNTVSQGVEAARALAAAAEKKEEKAQDDLETANDELEEAKEALEALGENPKSDDAAKAQKEVEDATSDVEEAVEEVEAAAEASEQAEQAVTEQLEQLNADLAEESRDRSEFVQCPFTTERATHEEEEEGNEEGGDGSLTARREDRP